MKNNFKFNKNEELCDDDCLTIDILYRNGYVDYFGIDVFGNVGGLGASTEFILEDVFEVKELLEIPAIKKLHDKHFEKEEVTK